MRDHNGDFRWFIHAGSAWYAASVFQRRGDVKDSITVGLYSPSGGTSGEFGFEWIELAGRLLPRLVAFDGSWSAMQHFNDLFTEMGEIDGLNKSPLDFCKLLLSLNIQDLTERSLKN